MPMIAHHPRQIPTLERVSPPMTSLQASVRLAFGV
jgi:hypothetical protein